METTLDKLQAEVLLLPHHGSVIPTLPAFVDAVDPSVIIVSAGNRPGHVEKLKNILPGREILFTGCHGAVTVSLTSEGIKTDAFRKTQF